MLLTLLVGCGGYQLDGADSHFLIEPVDAVPGARIDTSVPLRLETYGPTFEGGFTARPFHAFVQTSIEGEVECMTEMVLDASIQNDQVGIFLTPDINDFDDMVAAYVGTEGGRSGRSSGSYEAVIDFTFPCIDSPVPHRVEVTWEVDPNASIPYDGDPS